jgi:membrane associated rhomboid family serine protease
MSNKLDDFEHRKEAAFKVMRERGINPMHFYPPVHRMLARIGVRVKPPHFGSFIGVCVLHALYFGATWGLIMWLFVWQSTAVSPERAIGTSVGAGLTFGVAMAFNYAWDRRKHRLPSWETLSQR